MPGPLPKPPELRQRRNRVSTRATLPTEESSAGQVVPELPPLGGKRQWHPMAVAWWTKVGTSPMATEYLEADWQELFMLVRLVQDYWTARKAADRRAIFSEIRQQGQRFGISPIDRRRLQWEVEKGEQASDRTKSRRQKNASTGKDPREILKVV